MPSLVVTREIAEAYRITRKQGSSLAEARKAFVYKTSWQGLSV